jgi:4-hydroxy-2-oxoheptanedioate aldolase
MRATQYGFDTAYHDTADSKQAVIVQVESVGAIDQIPEIGEVEGVDVIFIGPRDLSATLGKVNQFDDPEVRAQIDRAEKMILRTGKLLGSIARSGEEARRMSERGYHLVVAGSDMSLLGNGVKAMLSQARERTEVQASETGGR